MDREILVSHNPQLIKRSFRCFFWRQLGISGLLAYAILVILFVYFVLAGD